MGTSRPSRQPPTRCMPASRRTCLMPSSGFILGLADPTMADLVIINLRDAFMPFGAMKKLTSQDPGTKYPKFKAHAERVAAHPSVKAYLDKSTSMAGNPFGI